MKWMVKSRINIIGVQFIFLLLPILVSFGSFFTYVYLGNKLDVATAFTAITLFNMIRHPLGVIPMFTVQLLQTGVAVNRISAYLDEDEVSGQVSSLKRDAAASHVAEDEQGDLGFENASFKWNEVEKKDEDKKKVEVKRPIWRRLGFRRSRSPSPSGISETATTVDAPEQQEHRFELRDLNVKFPQGVLTVVTGPTASGKTALLVRYFIVHKVCIVILTKFRRWHSLVR
jgi:ABC-type multidrug transport system fused ATPase/permease subunit